MFSILTLFDGIKTIFVIIGVVVILRFIKTAFATKHAHNSIKAFDSKKKQFEQEKLKVEKNKGKIDILDKNDKTNHFEDVDFEEVK